MDRSGEQWQTPSGDEDSGGYYPRYRDGDARRLQLGQRQVNGLTFSYLPGASIFEHHQDINHGGQHPLPENSLAAMPITQYRPVAQVPRDLHYQQGFAPSQYQNTNLGEPSGMQHYGAMSVFESISQRSGAPRLSLNISGHHQNSINTPSPSDYLSPYHQGPQMMGTPAEVNELTPPGTSPGDTGVFQYQEDEEMEEAAFEDGPSRRNENPRAMPGTMYPRENLQAEWMERTGSASSQMMIRPSMEPLERPMMIPYMQRTIEEEEARERERDLLRREQTQQAQHPAYGIPVNQNFGFFPNHVAGGPAQHGWHSQTSQNPSSYYSGSQMSNTFSSGGPNGTASTPGGYGYTNDCSAYARAANASSHPAPSPFTHPAPNFSGHQALDLSGHPVPLTDGNGIPIWQTQRPTFNPLSIGAHAHTPYTDMDGEGDDDMDGYSRLPSMAMSWPNRIPNTRQEQDEVLLRGREVGLSFKEIAKRLDMKGREATLRGRYRSLTKAKEERVRSPVWTDIDNWLLQEAVEKKLSRRIRSEEELNRAGIPWKEVAEYIKRNGGSYQFGAATVKKQYVKMYCSHSSASEE